MLGRKKSGSVVCRSCGRLVGVSESSCSNCGAKSPSLWGFAPVLRKLGQDLGFSQVVMFGCGILYVAMLVVYPATNSGGSGGFLDILNLGKPSGEAVWKFGASGALPVVGAGRWWTLLSAGWLHGGIFHIFFNLMIVRNLLPLMASAYGPGRAVIIYTLSSVAGFSATTLFFQLPLLNGLTGAMSLGASAAIFGLIGALLYYSRRAGARALNQFLWSWVIFMAVLGFVFPVIDNAAHLGGFGGGYLLGRWFDPLTPERIDHVAGALLCIVASVAAIAASLLVPLPF